MKTALFAAPALALLLAGQACAAEALATIPSLDLKRYAGTWY